MADPQIIELKVSELAARTGFAPSAIRFYERIGLLNPAVRARNGYRVFGEDAVEELSFIARAKGIGMQLEEIAEVRHSSAASECRSAHARLRDFVAERVAATRAARSELGAFEEQLENLLERLTAREPGPEPCEKGCDCEFDLEPATNAQTVAPAGGCTLSAHELRGRIADWHAIAPRARLVERHRDHVRIAFPHEATLAAQLCALCAAEADCCSHLSFALTFQPDSLVLTITADNAGELVEHLFGSLAP